MATRYSLSGLICFFCCTFTLSAQNAGPVAEQVRQLHLAGVEFTGVSLFSILPQKKETRHSEFEDKTQQLQLDLSRLNQLVANRPDAITLNLPWKGTVLRIELYQAPVMVDDFSVQVSGKESEYYTPGAYYRGIIENEPGSLAAISFFEDEIIGVIAHPVLGSMNLGRLDRPGNRTEYALFRESDIPEKPAFSCVERERGGLHEPPVQTENVNGCVRIFFECDYELFQNKGTVLATVNYVTGFFNVVSTLYNNESVSVAISQIYVWTTPDNYSTTSSGDALDEFRTFRTNFTGDLAHLVGLGGGGLGGIAYLDVLCVPGFNYGFSNINSTYQAYPTYSWTINVVTHELGHNLSSHHTHWCGWTGGAIDNCGPNSGYANEDGPCALGPTPPNGGTIMSYCHLPPNSGVNFTNGFGPQPGDAIRSSVSTSGCLASTCPVITCAAPTALTASSITPTSASIGWNSVSGGTSYNLQYRIAGTASWTTVNGVSSPYTISNLAPATVYEVQVQAVCGGNASPYATGLLFKTQSSACTEPSNLTATNPTATSVQLNWTENGSATQWDVEYGLQGFVQGSGTTINVVAKPYTLNGLTVGTNYDFYVRSKCGGTAGNSTWVGPLTFTTSPVNDLSSGAIEIFVDQPCPGTNAFTNAGATTTSGEFSPSTANGGYWNTGISNTVWFKFLAPPSGSVKVTTDVNPLGTLDDTQIALYNTASPNSITNLLVSNEDGGQLGQQYATLAYYSGLTPGTYYYVQVDGWGTLTGTFCIEVYETFVLPDPGTSCTTYTQTSVNGSSAPTKWFNIYSKPNSFDIGLTVAAVKSSSNLGTVTVKEIRNASVPAAPNGVKYMQRYYNFASSLNQSGPKQVRLFFTDAELENLKTAIGKPGNTAEDLNISHYDGAVEDCTPNNNGSSGTSLITAVSATSIGNSGIFFLEFQSPGFSEMAAIFGNVALPVELVSFNGTTESNYNRLRWSTSFEKDIAYFIPEYSVDGTGPWRDLARIAPNPGAIYPKNYEFDDQHPTRQSYYRLKTVDTDGSIAYSDQLMLLRAQASGLFNLYPNPASDILFAAYQAVTEEAVLFRMFGADGRLILEQAVDVKDGINILPFDVQDLPPGLYFISVPGSASLSFERKY